MTDVLRTPDERFNELPDFPYAPNYLDDLKVQDNFLRPKDSNLKSEAE